MIECGKSVVGRWMDWDGCVIGGIKFGVLV
jgi:hypothetical protein